MTSSARVPLPSTLLACALALWAHDSARAVPTGMSPYIYGMHDVPDLSLFPSDGACAKGWITLLEYIGDAGDCVIDQSALADQGYGIIMRLDHGGGPPLPTTPEQLAGYAEKFARCVQNASGVKVWVVGNEPNIDWGYDYTPSEYAAIYQAVMEEVSLLPNADEHEVLIAGMSPWAYTAAWGDWDDGLATVLDLVRGNGVAIDGVAIHAYTREHSPEAITSDEWFPGREGKWHLHFRGYRDTLALLAGRGLYDLPLYITESGSVCDPPCDPYPDVDNGYFVALYEEIHAWNVAHPHQVVRAVTPYRWTLNDDGSGRDFCIGCSAPLRADLANAVALSRTWNDSGCHSPITPPPSDDAGVADDDAGVTSPDAGAAEPDAGVVEWDGGVPEPDAGITIDDDDDDDTDAFPRSVDTASCGCGVASGADGALLLGVCLALHVRRRPSRRPRRL